MTTAAISTEKLEGLRTNFILVSILAYVMITLQKPISHMYVVTFIYGIPDDWLWKYLITFLIGCVGVVIIFKGLSKDEVKGSLMGFLGSVIVWDSWVEMGLHYFEKTNQIPMVRDHDGTPVLLGSHVILEMSGLFMIILLTMTLFQKDMRCRMLLWIRKTFGLREGTGKPTSGLKPQTSRVAATEYLFVNWFMYIVMITTLDPRVAGVHHPFTYALSGTILAWSLFIFWKQTKLNEVGLMIRYGIGAAGVAWYNFEIASFWGWYKEPWIMPHINTLECGVILVAFIALYVFFWKTPVNPVSGKSIK